MALRVKKLGIFGQQKASTWDRVSRWGGTGAEMGEVSRRQTQGPDGAQKGGQVLSKE